MEAPAQLRSALKDRYTIEHEIGRGGMATVFLAHDVKHDRNVALKLLNPELGAVLGVERFLSEIKVTANLQHPNLLPLFDSGEVGGQLFYVMPFVEGESLRARLDREKQLPVDEAVRIALGIASALDYAHAHAVIHRDLKPENILLQHGEPVIADFGIALAVSRAGGARVTQTGLSLGTPQYMSPEQATGDRAIDGRSDIYSLGACLYEMIGGEAPHTGTTGQAIIAKLMTEEPRRLEMLRRAVPQNVAETVHRALEKLPADRWRTAKEFADGLRGARTVETGTRARAKQPTSRIAPIAAAVLGAVAIVEAALLMRPTRAAEQPTIRFHFVTPDSQRFIPTTPAIPFAVSSDARYIAYVGAAPVGRRLYVRDMQTLETRAMPGTDGQPLSPTISPDGEWLGYTMDDRIMKTPLKGGPSLPVLALEGRGNAGMMWFHPDTIVASIGGTLMAVPTNGGTPVVLSRPDSSRGEMLQWGPRAIHARFVAYIVVGTGGMTSNRLGILDRKSGATTIVDFPCTTVVGAVDDRIICIAPNGTAIAARIDAEGKVGPPQAVLLDVLVRPGGAAKAALSANGTFVYHKGLPEFRLVWVDTKGAITPIDVEPRAYGHPRVAPDGTRIAVSVGRSGGSDIWVLDLASKTEFRLTSPDGISDQPAWSADGKSIVYRWRSAGQVELRRVSVEGGVTAERLATGAHDPASPGLSQDGKTLVFASSGDSVHFGADLHLWPTDGSSKPYALETTVGHDYTPTFSRDAKWLLYVGVPRGPGAVFLRPTQAGGEARQVSTGRFAQEPLWSPDNKTVFYRSGRDVFGVDISWAAGVPQPQAARLLFTADMIGDGGYGAWSMAPDGKRFLMMQNVDRQEETVMIANWAAELRKLWKN